MTPSDYRDQKSTHERVSSICELMEDLRRTAEDLAFKIEAVDLSGLLTTSSNGGTQLDFYSEVRRFEIFLIQNALRHTRGSQVKAARLLRMKGTTLGSKLKTLNIDPRQYMVAVETQRG